MLKGPALCMKGKCDTYGINIDVHSYDNQCTQNYWVGGFISQVCLRKE